MTTDFLTSYDYYTSRRDMEVISQIVESLKKILEERGFIYADEWRTSAIDS